MDPKQLKKLQKVWYSRLKDEGYQDIEDEDENLIVHSVSLSYLDENEKARVFEIEEYFRIARQILHTDYLKGRDKFIWELYCDGKTHEEISKLVGLSRSRVSQVLQDIDRRLMRDGR